MRQIDESYLLSCFDLWKQAGRIDRGRLIMRMQSETGLGRTAIYKRFERLQNGESLSQASGPRRRGPSRKAKALAKVDRQAALIISSIKMATKGGKKSYVISTENAIEIAIKENLLDANVWDAKKQRSKIDRLMRSLGINQRAFEGSRAAVSWKANYVNEIWMVDATPLNKYYLNKRGSVTRKQIIAQNDKHLDDVLYRAELQKIWIYFAVDVFSGAWNAKAFAPQSRGENALDWRSFLTECFLEKQDKRIPFEGLPEILYSDQGSGIGAGLIRNMIRRLGCRPETHLPGNSRAKAYVEGRISAFKRSFEPALNLIELRNLAQLNFYITAFMVKHNIQQELYFRFLQGAKQRPIRKVSEKNIHDVTTTTLTRSVNAYGCISITRNSEKREYFVSRDIEKGTRLEIYCDLEGQIFAQNPRTGVIYSCDSYGRRRVQPGSYQLLDDKRDWGKTEAENIRSKVLKESLRVRRTINYGSLLPKESNIHPLRAQGREIGTHCTLPPQHFNTVEDARLYIFTRTGLDESEMNDEIGKAINDTLKSEMQKHDSIQSDLIHKICQLIKVNQKEIKEAQEVYESQ